MVPNSLTKPAGAAIGRAGAVAWATARGAPPTTRHTASARVAGRNGLPNIGYLPARGGVQTSGLQANPPTQGVGGTRIRFGPVQLREEPAWQRPAGRARPGKVSSGPARDTTRPAPGRFRVTTRLRPASRERRAPIRRSSLRLPTRPASAWRWRSG